MTWLYDKIRHNILMTFQAYVPGYMTSTFSRAPILLAVFVRKPSFQFLWLTSAYIHGLKLRFDVTVSLAFLFLVR